MATSIRGVSSHRALLRSNLGVARKLLPRLTGNSLLSTRLSSSSSSLLLTSDHPRNQHLFWKVSHRSYHEQELDTEDIDDDDDDSDSDDDDDSELKPWKTLLDLPSRAAWRSSDPSPPDSVLQAQANVLRRGGASTKQIRRTYGEVVVASHRSLALRRERERRRMLNRTRYSRRAQLRDEESQPVFYGRLETLSFLWHRLHPNYAITKRVLEETKSLLRGNAWKPRRIIDMGIGVGSASASALEIFPHDVEWVHGIDPSRCMRECSKALLEEIMEQQTIQKNHNQQEDGEEEDSSDNSSTRVNPARLTLSGSIATDASSSTFDLAIFAYTATELPHVASTLAAAAILWQKLAHNGVFIMIEPGTPDGFNSIRAVRNMLLDCCPPNDTERDDDDDGDDEAPKGVDQCHIIAPCTHNGKCPMERYQRDFFEQKDQPKTQLDIPFADTSSGSDSEEEVDDDGWDADFEELLNAESLEESDRQTHTEDQTDLLGGRFCSFVQTMSSGHHKNKGEKFSYLVAQKRIPGDSIDADESSEDDAEFSFQNERVRDLLAAVYEAKEDNTPQQKEKVQSLFEDAQALKARYLDSEDDDLGLEFLQGDTNRTSFGRIIRAPMKKKGHVYIDYCAAPGRLMRSRVSKALDYSVAPGLFTVARKSRWGGLWPDVSKKPN